MNLYQNLRRTNFVSGFNEMSCHFNCHWKILEKLNKNYLTENMQNIQSTILWY